MINQLKEKANYIRKNVVEISLKNGAGHIAPSLSCLEILIALYYKVMNIPKNQTDPGWANRDRLVFSKAHGCYGLYAILADISLLPLENGRVFMIAALYQAVLREMKNTELKLAAVLWGMDCL